VAGVVDANADAVLATLVFFHAASIIIADRGSACWHLIHPSGRVQESSIKVCI
jgi:hypothetical protein